MCDIFVFYADRINAHVEPLPSASKNCQVSGCRESCVHRCCRSRHYFQI